MLEIKCDDRTEQAKVPNALEPLSRSILFAMAQPEGVMKIGVSFGTWIRQRRKALDMTQATLAHQVGCSVSAIRKIEADERRPSKQIAALLAEHLEIPQDERGRFLKVARAVLGVGRLSSLILSEGAGTAPGVLTSPTMRWMTPLLPIPPTPLIGRQRELIELAALLHNPHCRLLTLVGPGGIGKTRLALQAALNTAGKSDQLFSDGVSFTPLAYIHSFEHVILGIANTVGFAFFGPGDPKVQLLSVLRGRAILLVLDNVEHLLAGTLLPVPPTGSEGGLADLLSEILLRAPGVKILATSRERLNLQGEWVFEIHGLPIPPSSDVEGLEDYSAVALFIQSARRVNAGFVLSEKDRPAIVRICQLTEGLPLGIELAAAWTRVLSCQEIAQEIERSLDFLSASARDLPERHRSVRTVFDHSWNLLSEQEKRVLSGMSVFQSSFRRDAAALVTGANLAVLSALVDKSLLRRVDNDRYELHELVHQYAADKLRENSKEQGNALEQHCEFYMMFVQERCDRLNRDRKVVKEIRAELEDLHAAWLWALSDGRLDLIEMGSAGLSRFYRLTGLLKEGEAAFDFAVERVSSLIEERGEGEQSSQKWRSLLVGLLVGQAGLLNDRARHATAVEAARQAVVLADQISDLHSEAAAYLEWGQGLWRQSDPTGSQSRLERAISLSRLADAPQLEAGSQAILGLIHLSQGRISEALNCFEQALLLYRKIGDRHGESGVLNRLGTAYFSQGNLHVARAYFEKALQIYLEFGDRRGEGMGLNNLGVIAQGLGDLYPAKNYFEQTLPIARETGDRGGESAALSNLGVVLHRMGDFSHARGYYDRALQLCREIGERDGEMANLSNIGLLAYHQKELDSAQQVQRNVLRMAQERGSPEMESQAWMRLGRVLFDRERLAEAGEAYRKSVALRRGLGRINLTLEPLAGLTRVSLAMGELDQARDMVEDILTALDLPFSSLLDRTDDPYWVYLSCVLVLRADQDPRALDVLGRAFEMLQAQVRQIGEKGLRRSFLENLPGNRDLLKEWEREAGKRSYQESSQR